ncbi:MAG: hypothetical protein FJW90_09155 [Actinobacteria bacterium]|nr:hypothetical protein [Actinomycetota bacterium]
MSAAEPVETVPDQLTERGVPGLALVVVRDGEAEVTAAGLAGGGGHLEHLGGGGGFWTMMRILPERRLGVVTMGNATRYDHERLARAALAQS